MFWFQGNECKISPSNSETKIHLACVDSSPWQTQPSENSWTGFWTLRKGMGNPISPLRTYGRSTRQSMLHRLSWVFFSIRSETCSCDRFQQWFVAVLLSEEKFQCFTSYANASPSYVGKWVLFYTIYQSLTEPTPIILCIYCENWQSCGNSQLLLYFLSHVSLLI